MTVYTKGLPGELPEIRDFINMVFSMHSTPHNFRQLLPKIYEDGQQTEAYHYLAREDGKLRAVVCALPFTLLQDGYALSCAAIGSVSVHPDSRKQGYMKALMKWMQEDLKNQGISLSVLEGRRQRYEYFGYEPGGQKFVFQFIPDNFHHCRGMFPAQQLKLRRLTGTDTELLNQCYQLHQSQILRTERKKEDFFHICSSWSCGLYAVISTEKVCGYLCAFQEQVCELVLENESLLFSCLESCMPALAVKCLNLTVPAWNTERIAKLSLFCERTSIFQEDNYCVLDHKNVISFFMNLKARNQTLTNASMVIRPAGQCPFRITVQDNQAGLSDDPLTPCTELTTEEFISLLFSPAAFLPGRLPDTLTPVNWFPLPLSVSYMDKC